jgi:hypothetical protein
MQQHLVSEDMFRIRKGDSDTLKKTRGMVDTTSQSPHITVLQLNPKRFRLATTMTTCLLRHKVHGLYMLDCKGYWAK